MTPRPTYLHLGSGNHVVSGWVNVDKSLGPWLQRRPRIKDILVKLSVVSREQALTPWPEGVVRRDLTKRFPWPDSSVAAIYSSHTLEHLTRKEAREVLQECRRVLAPGGILRLALPDLAAMVDEYVERRDADPDAGNRLIEQLYMAPEYDGNRVRRLAFRFFHRPHRWMYDSASIAALLSQVGYSEISPCGFLEGECPDLELLETRPDSLFIEARKT